MELFICRRFHDLQHECRAYRVITLVTAGSTPFPCLMNGGVRPPVQICPAPSRLQSDEAASWSALRQPLLRHDLSSLPPTSPDQTPLPPPITQIIPPAKGVFFEGWCSVSGFSGRGDRIAPSPVCPTSQPRRATKSVRGACRETGSGQVRVCVARD